MKLEQKFSVFTITLLMAVNLSAQSAIQTRNLIITLQDAVTTGKVEYIIAGMGWSSGDSIKLKIRKTAYAGSGPVAVSVPPDTVLRSASATASGGKQGKLSGCNPDAAGRNTVYCKRTR